MQEELIIQISGKRVTIKDHDKVVMDKVKPSPACIPLAMLRHWGYKVTYESLSQGFARLSIKGVCVSIPYESTEVEEVAIRRIIQETWDTAQRAISCGTINKSPMPTEKQIRARSGLDWNVRKAAIIRRAKIMFGGDDDEKSISDFGCFLVGTGQYDAAISLDELRLVYFEIVASTYLPGVTFDEFFARSIKNRIPLFVHPTTGQLLKTFLLTDAELKARFCFPKLRTGSDVIN